MGIDYIHPQFEVIRSESRCINCRICEKQCANGVHSYYNIFTVEGTAASRVFFRIVA